MIRRYYILPLRFGVPDTKVSELVDVLHAADRFIPGLRDSSAGLDVGSRTVLWENTFVDEGSYSGPYMVHPYHIDAIDNYVMADSPECLTQDIYTTRYQTSDATQPLRGGIRRVVLFDASSDADAAAVAELAAQPPGAATSAFGADDVGWVSAKGRAWSHLWEMSFADETHLASYLGTREGIACSSLEGFTRLGIQLRSLEIFTCPFELAPEPQQAPVAAPPDDVAVRYIITARTAADDVDRYIELLECLYDPFMVACGSRLLDRSRSVAHGYLSAEVESTWHLDSLAHYSDIRATTYADPAWNAFVRDAMPLVQGGTRRFHHAT